MTVLHIITSLRKSAGTTTFVNGLCNALVRQGVEAVVALLETNDEYVGERPAEAVRLVRINDILDGNRLFDIVHIHGLWEMPLLKVGRWAVRKGMPIVWSPHGALSPWAMKHHWWKKAVVWHLWQKPILKKASLFHATAEKEREWVRDIGFCQSIVVVPLGAQCPPRHQHQVFNFQLSTSHTRTLLFVGRIYPVKGLVNLIKAWGKVKVRGCAGVQDWKLRIVGPDQAGHRAELEQLVGKLGLNDSVEFPGPKFGDELEDEYKNCDCLVLPSFTENFGGVIVDALAHGKPCIASTFTPWKELVSHGCGWWTDNAPATLARTICEMLDAGDGKRREMGEHGGRLVEERYTWDAVAAKMVDGYKGLLKDRSDNA